MATAQSAYLQLLEQGTEALQATPLSGAAIEFYDKAVRTTRRRRNKAEAYQLLAVAYHAAGRYAEAQSASKRAIEYADGDEVLLGRIIRETYMTLLRDALLQDDADSKALLYGKIIHGFHQSVELLGRDPANQLEVHVSLGYVGRAFFATGRRLNAIDAMSRADHYLQQGDNRTYELDNLMWLLRATERGGRKRLRNRIHELIKQTGHIARLRELQLIMIGGDRLYRFVQRRRAVRK